MNTIRSRATVLSCALIAVVATVAAGHAGTAAAATLAVTNCNDTGGGSLRDRATVALSGDTIDLRGLPCRGITLTSGAIAFAQDNIAVQGPGFRRFGISGNYVDSVLRHHGTGTLRVRGVTLEKGNRREQVAAGGCVYSAGNVHVYDVEVRRCGAHGSGPGQTSGGGGGIFAAGNVFVEYSGIYNNTARGGNSAGGGILVGGNVTLRRAQILRNNARTGGGVAAGDLLVDTTIFRGNFAIEAGGIYASGAVTIANSTISGNTAIDFGGGLWLTGPYDKLIINTTISGNTASRYSGGVINNRAALTNSTVAFNNNDISYTPGGTCEGALGAFGAEWLHLESTIIASNTCDGGADWDVGGYPDWNPVTGSNNLVMSSNRPLPPDTVTADPRLAPLAANGGRTQTHTLLDGSPAIDRGNNESGLPFDQRGVGFPRVKGARADIGAVER